MNRDQAKEDKLAKAALQDIENELKKSGKSFASSPTTAPSTSSSQPDSKAKSFYAPAPSKPIQNESTEVAKEPVVLFQKKRKEVKVDPDLATWTYKQKEVRPTTTESDLDSIDILKDDSKPPAKPTRNADSSPSLPTPSENAPKKSLFKKRQIRVSK